MKEFKYSRYKYPIILHDDGKITYRDREIEKYFHGYKTVGVGSGFTYNQLSKQHYISEMNRIDRQIEHEEYYKAHKEEFDNLPTVEECLNEFFKFLEE